MKLLMARCGRQMIVSKSRRNGSGTLNEFETKLRLTLHFNDIANVRLAVLCPEISAVYVASKHDGATHDDGIQNFSLRISAGLHCYQFWPDRYAAGFVAGNQCSRWYHRFGCCHQAGQAPLHGNLSQLHQPPTSTFGFDNTNPTFKNDFPLVAGLSSKRLSPVLYALSRSYLFNVKRLRKMRRCDNAEFDASVKAEGRV